MASLLPYYKCDTFRQGTIRRKLDSLHVNLEILFTITTNHSRSISIHNNIFLVKLNNKICILKSLKLTFLGALRYSLPRFSVSTKLGLDMGMHFHISCTRFGSP